MSDKTIRLLVDLTYDAEMAHGDDKGAIEWFNDILMGDDLQLCSFNEFGDTIGKVKAVDQQEAARIEELEANLAKAVEALERIEDASKYFANCPEATETTVRYAHETTRRLATTTLAALKGQADE